MEDATAYPILEPPAAVAENSRFSAAIIAALALHLAALAIGLYTPTTQRMGEATGSEEGLSVEIVDESEIPSAPGQASPPIQPAASTPPVQPSPAVEQAAAPPEPAVAEQPPTEAAAAPQPLPEPPPPDLKPSTHEEAAAPAKPPPSKAETLDTNDPGLFKIEPDGKKPTAPAQPSPANAKPAPPAKQAKAAKPEKQSQISLAVPMPSFTSSNEAPGRSAGVSRPAGITRSGLNDEFGRGVIRALRQTMPPNNRIAQATVRFVLSKDGNLQEVELVASSGDPVLDQNVVFAVKQANFPIPATNLTALDRQFRVTYLYR